jgi:hypothetical protein
MIWVCGRIAEDLSRSHIALFDELRLIGMDWRWFISAKKLTDIHLIQILFHDSAHLEAEVVVTMPVKLSDKNRRF